MSSDDGNCGTEEGEECVDLSGTGLIIFYWVWMVVGTVVNLVMFLASDSSFDVFARVFRYVGIVRRGSDCDQCLQGGWCFVPELIAISIVCACLGPLPLGFLLCWCLWMCLRLLCCFCVDLLQQAARRKTQLAVDRLRRFPGKKTWQARGWLIMMRARHRRSLARSTDWRARLWKLERYDETSIIKDAMKDAMTGQTSPEIELLEAGRLRMNFVRTVLAVIEIEEEGLFRHITTYL
ncbi:unnamed protein product [Ectocarpus fasciculatus]